MRAVILGTDLMYNQAGKLVPIEINTNVGFDLVNRVEKDDEWLDVSSLVEFIKKNKFKKVILDYRSPALAATPFKKMLEKELPKVLIDFTEEQLEDVADDELFIRVLYNEEALVDSFCRDKIAFLKALSKSSKIAQEFIYKEDGELKGSITNFVDNGDKPNYIVKFRYPRYDSVYPKYYKLNSLEEVQYAANVLGDDYFISPCYLNDSKMYEGERYRLIRQWSLLVPDRSKKLKAINLGSYTKLSGKPEPLKLAENGEVLEGQNSFLSKYWVKTLGDSYLDKDDEILMADFSWKKIQEVKTEDKVFSVGVPYAEGVDIRKHAENYKVDEQKFISESQYILNSVTNVEEIEGFYNIVHLWFKEDQEEWWDTEDSSYPVINQDGTVGFKEIRHLEVGDKVLLVKVDKETVEYLERTITKIESERKFTTGYTISLDGSHLFISRSPESKGAYATVAALEHNAKPGGVCECEPASAGCTCKCSTFAGAMCTAQDPIAGCYVTTDYC